MKWKTAPLIKVYEALGSIADKRFEVDGNTAKLYSSSGNKYYDVIYDPTLNSITSNDNASFYVGYLGYPSIALLLLLGAVDYDPLITTYLKGFAWKDINQKFNNDFDKTQAYIDEEIVRKYDVDIDTFHLELNQILDKINVMSLNKLKSDAKPPRAY